MKKIFLLLASSLLALNSFAEMSIISNSFRDYASRNTSVGGDYGMGVTDMTAESIDWPLDQNGDDDKLGLLVIYFQNMAPEDVDKVVPVVDKPSYVHSSTTQNMQGRTVIKTFFEAGDNLGFTFNHPMLGSVRLTPRDYKAKHVYEVGILNAGTVPLVITTEPAGATVTLDGQRIAQKTPVTIEHVKMGEHSIAISPADVSIAKPVGEHTIYVSSSKQAFDFPMYKTKTVTIEPNPSSAYVKVLFGSQIVAQGTGSIVLPNVPYNRTYTLVGQSGTDEMTTTLPINDLTPDTYKFKIIGARAVSFTAKQNNAEVDGAQITINGVNSGYTPYATVLDYGKYEVSASFHGYTTKKMIKVNKNSKDFLLKIPNHKTVGYNPFDIDYREREWGITANYVHRFFKFKHNGHTTKYNWVGEEGNGSNGVQVGITWQPYFKYGQGLSTGLYWQGTFGKRTFGTDAYGVAEEVSYNESALYFPLQYQFRLPLHKNFSIAVNAGAAITLGLSNKFSNSFLDDSDSYDIGYGYNEQFDTYYPDKFDYSLIIGAAIQFKALQIEGKYSIGLKDHTVMHAAFPDAEGSLSYKSSFLSAGISLMF